MEISQDLRTGAHQKGLVFWMRVHKTFHDRKMFEPYQITSNRGIGSIQKRWLFIQQECNKYCAAFECNKEERQENGQVRRRWGWRGVEEAEGQDQLQARLMTYVMPHPWHCMTLCMA